MLPALIPIRDDNPTRRLSVVTIALIIINVAVFFTEPSFGTGRSPRLFTMLFEYGMIPREVLSGSAVGPSVCETLCPANKSVYLSLITSMFLHGGLLHLGGNMLALWIFGNNVEDWMGRGKFLAFYLAGGVGASLVHAFTHPDSVVPTVGASGAVAAAMGAYIVLFPRARVLTILPLFIFWQFIELPAIVALGFWFALQFFIGVQETFAAQPIAWAAHVGGFILGALAVLLLGGRPSPGHPRSALARNKPHW